VKSSVTLPVKSMISVYFSNSEIVRLLGATDRVVAVDQTTLNKATMLPEFQKFKDDKDHIVDRFNPNSEQVLKIAADVYFTGSRATYGPNLEKEVGNVTEIVRLPAWEDNNEMAASLTFGYILGSTTMAYKYIDWANGYIDLVTERLKENDHDVMSIIVPKGRKESLEGNGLGSGQYEISELAGGNNLAKQLPATSEYPDFTIEWALTANPDLIVLSGYCGYEKTDVKTNVTDVMATAYKTYAHTAAADNGRIYFISNEIFTGPSAYIAMVYLATWMYPEIFADIDAEAVFQEYLDTFCPQMSSYDISAHILQHVCGPCATIDSAKLKVFGNVDGNEVIDSNDLAQIQLYVAVGLSADLCPMADANQDGKIDNADVEVIEKIIAGESTVVYHINYHDADGNGTMDLEIVSTKYPISSAIMTGSANSFMLTYLLGILDEIKGASYGSTNDKALYGSNYLDTSKTVKLGTSSSSITFEDGKAGSSDVIAKEHVTAVISDWNRTYITNEAAFEGANVDVVRVAAASVDPNVYTHSILLLGFLFQKEEKAQQLLALYNKVFESIDEALAGLSDEQIVKAVASSMTGYISSGESDYQAVVAAAGAKFGLEGYDFGGSASMKVVDHLDVYDTSKYSFDYIVQIRTALTYENLSADTLNKNWKSYTDAFNLWEHANDGQILVSGVIPVPLRVAYAACGMYSDVLSLDWANGLHKEFVDAFYAGSFDVDSLVFIMTAPVATA
ncbi:MAG: ABC transporter substrate-binding protein, partial [archaeon]|nr:ABC transporter substrate-binding protein [archaeon]